MSIDANVAYSAAKEQNYTMLQAFEWYSEGKGVHWKKLAKKVPELASIGITAMWIPPPTKAAGQESVGYDIYDLYDLGEFDQKGGRRNKYGTKEELIETVKKAGEAGIVTYVDAVLNHKFGADKAETFGAIEVDNDDRTKEVSELAGLASNSPVEEINKLKWNFNHFTGVDYDENTGKKAIFRIQGDGKYWASGVDNENQNYDYLMGADIDHSHPEAHEDVINWGKWIINEIGAAGFRFDAVKHIDSGFIADFVKAVRQGTDKPKMFAVGEFWKDSLEDLEAYLESLGTQFSVFDAPLHYKFKEAGDCANEYDLRTIWDGTVVQKRPIDAVTLVDNHDCVFWGDLYGTEGPEGNPQQPVSQLGDLIRARKLFAYGELRDYWDHMNCVGWVRMGDPENGRDGCAVVLCNGDEEGTKRMEVGKEHAGEKWTDILGWYEGEIVIGDDGWADFKSSARSVSVWVKEGAKGREEFGKQ
ncbi:hypothetical protein VNI00_006190 [Paramarasmius palmivorus]|uniref:Glycosyl hydrolase family 13 catalytic domain-containing protein n=1 Tax=Paramarasmius palmivorus TaxID=297713 RepID=A0AAW0DBF8_9AGAR